MKRNAPVIAVGLLVALALLLYMVTFEVRFNQTAVLTTFGKAGPGAVKNEPVEGADTEALDEGLISVTPLSIEATRPGHLGVAAYVAGLGGG